MFWEFSDPSSPSSPHHQVTSCLWINLLGSNQNKTRAAASRWGFHRLSCRRTTPMCHTLTACRAQSVSFSKQTDMRWANEWMDEWIDGWMEMRINNSLEVGVLPRPGPDSLWSSASLASERTQEKQSACYLKRHEK